MVRRLRRSLVLLAALAVAGLSGCTSLQDYVHNGFKVGPNYSPARAQVAKHWIDSNDVRVRAESANLACWWLVFNDPVLNDLVHEAHAQNLSLKAAGARILQARAQLGIAAGNLLPQNQTFSGNYERIAVSTAAAGGNSSIYTTNVGYGFNLAWELDFWGRFRRAVAAAENTLDASVENYDAALVTLLGDLATNYVQVRQLQEQINLTKANVELQTGVLRITRARLRVGTVSKLDADQAEATLRQTAAQIPVLEIAKRQAENQLCVLLGVPVCDLKARLGERPIPTAPPEAAVGIPAELLTRRPDVRAAERVAEAQAEQIGIAQAEFYPHISISGTLGAQAANFGQLFSPGAFAGSVGTGFTWNILNYGRIAWNVRLQDARLQELLLNYRNTVLTADQEAEDGIVVFLESQLRAREMTASVIAAQSAMDTVISQYKVGTVDFNRVATIEQALVQAQDLQAQARSQIAQGLIQIYRALGGGWEIRLPGPPPAMGNGQPQPAPQPALQPMPQALPPVAPGPQGVEPPPAALVPPIPVPPAIPAPPVPEQPAK